MSGHKRARGDLDWIASTLGAVWTLAFSCAFVWVCTLIANAKESARARNELSGIGIGNSIWAPDYSSAYWVGVTSAILLWMLGIAFLVARLYQPKQRED